MSKKTSKTTKVIKVTQAPGLKNPHILQGVRDEARAEEWGVKNGYAVVYFIPRRQKVYAERLRTDVAEQAKALQEKAVQLALFAEGEG